MEYHDEECTAANGRVTPKPHYFCSNCDIEALPNGKWRSGSVNPYRRQYVSQSKYEAEVKASEVWHDP